MDVFLEWDCYPPPKRQTDKSIYIDKRILLLQTDRLIKGSKLTSQNGFETE